MTIRLRQYRDLIIRAVEQGGSDLDLLAARLDDAAHAKQTLHIKGYGTAFVSLTALVAQVPVATIPQSGQIMGKSFASIIVDEPWHD